MIESFLQDIRIGFRVLFKEKSFCFLAVLVLALGICGVTTQFTLVNAFVLRGFSFSHPEQLMGVGSIRKGRRRTITSATATFRRLKTMRICGRPNNRSR
jgi:hypothetical protein